MERRKTITGLYVSLGGILVVMSVVAASRFLLWGLEEPKNYTMANISVVVLGLLIFVAYEYIDRVIDYLGLDKGYTVFLIKRELREQLISAGYYTESHVAGYIVLPKIEIDLSDDLSNGSIMIEDNLKFRLRLDEDISMALPGYTVDTHYTSDNGKWYVYEIVRSDIDNKCYFHSLRDYFNYCDKIPEHELFIDRNLSFPISHLLLTGQTGAGKSYALYNLLLQLLNKSPKMREHLYFVDPKCSGLYLLGSMVNANNTAATFEAICEQIRTFNEVLSERNETTSEQLKTRLDGDYTTFGMLPYVMIFEEYGAFQALLQSREKRVRDEIGGIIEKIIYMGRQSGCFLVLVSQQVSAAMLPTKIRDNIPAKFLLGRGLETETAVCCFGQTEANDLPSRKMAPGEAFYKIAGINAHAKKCVFPLLDFDIMSAVNYAVRGRRQRPGAAGGANVNTTTK